MMDFCLQAIRNGSAKKASLFLAGLLLATQVGAQSLDADNISHDPQLLRFLQSMTEPGRNRARAILEEASTEAKISVAERQAIPSGPACMQKMLDMAKMDLFTPGLIQRLSAVSAEERQSWLPFIEFLHGTDGARYLELVRESSETLADGMIGHDAADTAAVNGQKKAELQRLIEKQANAGEIANGAFGLSLFAGSAMDAVAEHVMLSSLQQMMKDPICQAMQREADAYKKTK